MLNQVILVGKLLDNPKLEELEDGRKVTYITLEIKRAYKNVDSGDYDTDEIKCTLWSGIAENTVEYCQKGSTVGVKARLMSSNINDSIEVVAEKITFINTKEKDLNLKS